VKCLGRTPTFKRCKNDARILFCHHHRFQPWQLFIFIIGFIGVIITLWLGLLIVLDKFQSNPVPFTYIFPKFEDNLEEQYKSTNFTAETLDAIKSSFHKPLNSNDRCPCGSGKGYGECHSPEVNNGEKNNWRGPGFKKFLYLGYRKPLNGFYFQKKKRGEIIVLQKDVRVSLCNFYAMEYSILINKAIVQDNRFFHPVSCLFYQYNCAAK